MVLARCEGILSAVDRGGRSDSEADGREDGRSRLRPALRRMAAGAFAFGLVTVPLAGALAALLYVLLAPARRAYHDRNALAWVGLFGGLSVALAPHPLASVLAWLGWLGLGTAFVLLAQRWSAMDGSAAVVGFALGAVVASGWEARQRVFLGQPRPEGFTVHPNLEAGLLLAVLGAVAIAWSHAGGFVRRLAVAAAFLAALVALALTGSRGAVLGLVFGAVVWLALYLWRFSWKRLLPWLLGLAVLIAAGAAAELWLQPRAGTNRLVDAGFAWGDLAWELGTGGGVEASSGTGAPPAAHAVRLAHDRAGWQVLLGYRSNVSAHPGERLTISLWARPAENALPSAFVRVEALAADGSFLARAGRTGWTTGDEGRAGGRLVLPVKPAGAWHRVVFTLPPVPARSASLKLVIADDAGNTGTYGDVTAFQLQDGASATPYVPGPRPGLRSLAGPLLTRWLALRDPTQASGGRLSMWWFGLQLASYRPVLGYGPGTELSLVKKYALDYVPRPLTHLHSFYLKMLVEGGSVTLAALLAWLGLTAWRLFTRARAGSAAAAVALATMVALLVHSAFDPVLAQPYIAGSMWLVVCSGLYGEDRVAGDQPS